MLQVSAIKQKIEELQQFPVSQQKLIHAGKVLKDDSTLSVYNVKENDFLVVMVTKPKAAKPPAAAAPSASAAAATSPASAATAAAATPTPNTSSASNSSSVTASAVSTPSAAPATTAATSSMGDGGDLAAGEQMSATVQQLVDMGFPADQVRSALRAAFNNPERAVEYLMTGIPEQAAQVAAPSAGVDAGADASGDETANTLEALRNHPQFDALRQLVQSNPAALPAVLQQIGAQSPDMLRLIHQNQDRFVQMLNEPIGTHEVGAAPGGAGVAPFDLGMGGGGAMPSPQQIQQLVDSLSPEQQSQMAAQMGMTPEQLRGLSQMLSNLPPGAMEQMMASMGGGSGLEALGGGAEAGAGGGGRRIMLSEEEAAAVDRLCEMGFERTDAIQAYLACDKNEALAANFLMDSGDSFGGDAAGGAGGQGDDNDDIYG
uniref:UV excision repair protein RAD23 n=1 Tax=Hyaloperonospora arabidopsidis (strain Emoy2) TaxID=559515 RepID=M4C6L6_HYAAE